MIRPDLIIGMEKELGFLHRYFGNWSFYGAMVASASPSQCRDKIIMGDITVAQAAIAKIALVCVNGRIHRYKTIKAGQMFRHPTKPYYIMKPAGAVLIRATFPGDTCLRLTTLAHPEGVTVYVAGQVLHDDRELTYAIDPDDTILLASELIAGWPPEPLNEIEWW